MPDTLIELPVQAPVEIPVEILAQIEALPDKRRVGYEFSPWQDAVIRMYWHSTKPQREVCRILGLSRNTVQKRFDELEREATA